MRATRQLSAISGSILPKPRLLALWLTIGLSASLGGLLPTNAGAQTTLTVRECIDRALEANLQLQQLDRQREISGLNHKQARLDYLPSASGTVDLRRNFGTSFDFLSFQRVDQNTSFSSPTLSANLELFGGFAKYYTLQQTETTLSADHQAYQAAANQVITQVLTQYLLILFDQGEIQQVKNRLELLRSQLERTSALVEAGTALEADQLNLEAQIALEEANLTDRENQLARDRLGLLQLLQLDPAREYRFVMPDTSTLRDLSAPLPSLTSVLDYALRNMPEVREALLRQEAAAYQVKLARAARMPRLTFSAGLASNYTSNGGIPVLRQEPIVFDVGGETVTLTDPNGDPVTQNVQTGLRRTGYFQQVEDNFSQFFNFTLQIPIFTRWNLSRNQQVAQVNTEIAALNVDQTRLQLRQTIEQAYLDARGSQKRVKALERQLEAFNKAFEQVENQYEAGALTFYDYLETLNNQTGTRLQLQQARLDFFFKRNILAFYAGNELDF